MLPLQLLLGIYHLELHYQKKLLQSLFNSRLESATADVTANVISTIPFHVGKKLAQSFLLNFWK